MQPKGDNGDSPDSTPVHTPGLQQCASPSPLHSPAAVWKLPMGFGSDNSKRAVPAGALLTSGGDSFSTLQTRMLQFEGLKHRKANCSVSASTEDQPPIWGDSDSDISASKCSLQDQLDTTQLKKAPAAKGKPSQKASPVPTYHCAAIVEVMLIFVSMSTEVHACCHP